MAETATLSDAQLKELLHEASLRVTGVRLAVLRALAVAPSARTAAELADSVAALAMGHADRVTVYRTLNTLLESGLAHKIDPGDRTYRYTLTDHSHCDGERHDHEHPHLVCESCGDVQCLQGAEVIVQTRPGAKGKRVPFKVKTQGVTLRGTCDKCMDKPARKAR